MSEDSPEFEMRTRERHGLRADQEWVEWVAEHGTDGGMWLNIPVTDAEFEELRVRQERSTAALRAFARTEVNTNDESVPGKGAAGPAAGAPEPTGGAHRRRFRWRTEHYSPEEQARARQQWRDAMPWQHPMSRGDKGLVLAVAGVLLLTAATMPLRPFLLASHPVALSAVTGSLSAIGAGAAFARVGEGARCGW